MAHKIKQFVQIAYNVILRNGLLRNVVNSTTEFVLPAQLVRLANGYPLNVGNTIKLYVHHVAHVPHPIPQDPRQESKFLDFVGKITTQNVNLVQHAQKDNKFRLGVGNTIKQFVHNAL